MQERFLKQIDGLMQETDNNEKVFHRIDLNSHISI